jgi:hypothetical protein
VSRSVGRALRLARLGLGLRGYLGSPLDREEALGQLRARMSERENNFLRCARKLIYENSSSPYGALLRWAGCEYGDLEEGVRTRGIEGTLAQLSDAGVHVSLGELKQRQPIVRSGLTIEQGQASFGNPLFGDRGIEGKTSGSRSPAGHVRFAWRGFAEEAANELLLYEIHGVARAPLALWLSAPPWLAGMRNVLINAKISRPPSRWFVPVDSKAAGASALDRLATAYVVQACRLFGIAAPYPELVELAHAEKVARWLEDGGRRGEVRVLSTFASPAMRVARAVREHGIDVGRHVVFSSGEPLTARRRRFIESAGLRVLSRYVAAESGLIAADCGNGERPDAMHLYTDRLAVRREADGGLLFTSLSLNAGTILFNTSLGDCGRLERRTCGCLFGQLGMDMWLSDVRSVDKLTGEGGTLLGTELDEIVAARIERAGGGPDDYQFREVFDDRGFARLLIAVSPGIRINELELVEAILAELRARHPAQAMTADLWSQAGTVEVVRARPEMSGFKLLPLLTSREEPTR